MDTRSDKIPVNRKVLLEFNHGKLCRSNIYDKTHWVVAMEAAIIAGYRTAATGARQQILLNMRQMYTTRGARLGISEVEDHICLDRYSYVSVNKEQLVELFCSHAVFTPLSRRQYSSSVSMKTNLRSSKPYKLGD